MNTIHNDTTTKTGCYSAASLAGCSTFIAGIVILAIISWMSSINAMVLTMWGFYIVIIAVIVAGVVGVVVNWRE